MCCPSKWTYKLETGLPCVPKALYLGSQSWKELSVKVHMPCKLPASLKIINWALLQLRHLLHHLPSLRPQASQQGEGGFNESGSTSPPVPILGAKLLIKPRLGTRTCSTWRPISEACYFWTCGNSKVGGLCWGCYVRWWRWGNPWVAQYKVPAKWSRCQLLHASASRNDKRCSKVLGSSCVSLPGATKTGGCEP